MSKPYHCPECEKIYVTTGDYSSCPNGHGRLRPRSDGLTPSAMKRHNRREAKAATRAAERATLPTATRVPNGCFHNSIYTIAGLPGLYYYSTEKTDLRAKTADRIAYFQRANLLEKMLENLGWKLEAAP